MRGAEAGRMTEAARRRVVVYHREYGCDTGCCGHVIEIDDEEAGWAFDHPDLDDEDEARLDWAKELVRDELGEDHVADLDWENCDLVSDVGRDK
jgi:hypothetical protein